MTNWTDLEVYNDEGERIGTLGEFVAENGTKGMTFGQDGSMESWFQYFIAAPGEVPDYDTPRGPVDWTGLARL